MYKATGWRTRGVSDDGFWPGGTQEQYRAMIAAVHPPDGLPDDQITHAAGPAQGGFLIAAIWDSKVTSDRSVSETLMPSMPVQGGFDGEPEERTAEVSSLATS